MKKFKKLIAVMVLGVTLCGSVLLCACGSAEQAVCESIMPEQSAIDTEEPEKQWTLNEINLPDADEALKEVFTEVFTEAFPELSALEISSRIDGYSSVMHIGLVGNTIYRYVQVTDGVFVTHYCIQTLEEPYTEWKNQVITVDNSDVKLMNMARSFKFFSPEGELSCIFDLGGFYREVISPDGEYRLEPIEAEGMAELKKEADTWYIHDGKDYIYIPDGLMCFQENFTVSEMIGYQKAMIMWQMAETASGDELYMYGVPEDRTKVAVWAADKKEPVIIEDIECIVSDSRLIFSSETEGYLCDADYIWQFSVSEGKFEKLEAFQENAIHDLREICDLSVEDDSLLILAKTVDGYSLVERSQKDLTDKKVLELAIQGADAYLKESVVRFNRQNEEYEIVLRERPEDTYWEDYQARIQAEISGGGGPDLIFTSMLNIEDSAERGFLRDLTEDFADQKGEIVESVMQSGMVDGRQYAIPYKFVLETMTTGQHIVGDKTSWTVEEAMDIARNSGMDTMGVYIDGPTLFRYLGFKNENNSQFIDWENGVCNLNSPEVVELLEFSAEYGDERDLMEDLNAAEEAGEMWGSSDRIARGEVLAEMSYIVGMFFVQSLETLYGECESEPVFIGFPVESGKSGHVLQCSEIAVNQACEYPEGAVEFLKFLQSEEEQERIVERLEDLLCGFPVRKSSLDHVFENARNGEYSNDTMVVLGEVVDVEPISQEIIDKLWNAIETAEPRSRRLEKVLSIIDEETAPFFAGERSAQEVLDILQNRVQLYLDETN